MYSFKRFYLFWLILFVWFSSKTLTGQNKILMFVSHEDTYYSEFIVMREALQHAGFTVEIRSATSMPATTYMIPANTTIDATANTLPGGSYAQFQNQYQNYFGNVWNSALNTTPTTISVFGSIMDVENIDAYVALVIVGGIGAQAYNVDGVYSSQGAGPRFISATVVQNVAERLNSLAVDALLSGKPVMGQCHGAGIPAHWRYPVPNNTPPGGLGQSILFGGQATGFPEAATQTTLNALGINYSPNSPVIITSPSAHVPDNGLGNHKIITTRDWYPQTVAHAGMTLINLLSTFPNTLSSSVDVLILHGGAVDANNCHHTNRNNDIPCNYGNGSNDLPADFTHIENLLLSNSLQDDYVFNVTNLNIVGGSLPFNNLDECSMISYFNQFDVLIFYKHWSTGVTPALQQAIVSYVDYGGGLVALHHGLYNDNDPPTSYNKDILVNQLFNAQSAQAGWGASRINYNLINTNLGHFITTYGINHGVVVQAPATWFNQIPTAVNTGYSYYAANNVFDEIYTNMAFVGSPVIGRNINQITPLFGIGQLNGSQNFTSGFLKLADVNNDQIVGKLAFLQAGETRTNFNVSHHYGQTIRNAIYWAGYNNNIGFPVARWNVGSGIWNNALNWQPQRLPRPCDQVVLPNNNVPYTVTVPTGVNYTIKSLTLQNNANLSLPNTSSLITQP